MECINNTSTSTRTHTISTLHIHTCNWFTIIAFQCKTVHCWMRYITIAQKVTTLLILFALFWLVSFNSPFARVMYVTAPLWTLNITDYSYPYTRRLILLNTVLPYFNFIASVCWYLLLAVQARAKVRLFIWMNLTNCKLIIFIVENHWTLVC
jgi:hypothetical protein